MSLLVPERNDTARRAAQLWAYRLTLLMEYREPPAPGARTNLLLRLWHRAGDSWPQSRLGGAALPGENLFLRWLLGDDARARRVIAAAQACSEDHQLNLALDTLAVRVREARLAAVGPWRGPTGFAGSILSAKRQWYCRLPV
jgi:hypothetical protein